MSDDIPADLIKKCGEILGGPKTVLFRPPRHLLEDALNLAQEVNSIDQIIDILKKDLVPATRENTTIEYYCFDSRINWNTYIVLVDGNACGFTNGPL